VFTEDTEGASQTLVRGQRVPEKLVNDDPIQIERLAVIGAIQFFEEPPAVPAVPTSHEVTVESGVQPLPENLEDLTVEQLRAEADTRHIDLGDARRKEEIIARLRSA
jgi:hypothetical protein